MKVGVKKKLKKVVTTLELAKDINKLVDGLVKEPEVKSNAYINFYNKNQRSMPQLNKSSLVRIKKEPLGMMSFHRSREMFPSRLNH